MAMSEKVCWALIKKYAKKYTERLELTNKSITWHVQDYKSRVTPDSHKHMDHDARAVTWYNSSKKNVPHNYDIIIYKDMHCSVKDVKGSIIHELLHVRLRNLDTMVKASKTNEDKFWLFEEKLVLILEKIIVDQML